MYLKSIDIDMNHKVLKFPPHYSKPKEKKPKRIQNERDKIVTKTVVQERNQVLIVDSFDFLIFVFFLFFVSSFRSS